MVCDLLCLRFRELGRQVCLLRKCWLICTISAWLTSHSTKDRMERIKTYASFKVIEIYIFNYIITVFWVNENKRNTRAFTGYCRIYKLIIALTKNFWLHILITLNDRTFAWNKQMFFSPDSNYTIYYGGGVRIWTWSLEYICLLQMIKQYVYSLPNWYKEVWTHMNVETYMTDRYAK